MDLRSGRRLGSRSPPQLDGAPCHRRGPGGADRISNLSDDMILQVLTRLRCVRTAVRTGLLSRRWRGLWTRLTDLAFRGVGPATIEASFPRSSAASPAGTVFQLDIHLPSRPQRMPADADSLLRAAAMLSPAGLVFTIPSNYGYYMNPIKLPCFQHATSIELDTHDSPVKPLAASEFPVLERLSMSGMILFIDDFVALCPRLRVLRAKFRSLGASSIGQVLSSLKRTLASSEVAVSLIDVSISEIGFFLLGHVANLSPQELVYTNSYHIHHRWPHPFELPFFHRTTSIEINWQGAMFTLPSHSGKFSELQRLCLFGCSVDNLGKLVSCCPRLRVLRVDGATSKRDIVVHSTSLQELILGTYKECRGIDFMTPVLKKLKMEVHAGGDIGASISAALVEKVSMRRFYTGQTLVFGFWLLQSMSIETTERNGGRVLDDTSLQVQQLPHAHVLSVDMCASDPSDINLNFAQEIEKLHVTDYSAVDLRLEAKGHVYGATLLHLLQELLVQNAIKILKVTLLRSEKSEVTRPCIENCSCNEPKDWRSQSISLAYLEEVEIIGFKGENHGFEFLQVLLRCAPTLKKVTMKLGSKIKLRAHQGCTQKIYNISMAYPSVNFNVFLSCGTLVLHPRLPCS